jgi:CheY-like chemotaxis protein
VDVDRQRISIEISDDGLGMTSEEIANAFVAFSQGEDKLASRQFGGLGLGLAISHSLVGIHSGTIKAASEGKNRGSTVTIEFPAIAQVNVNGVEVSYEPSLCRAEGVTILLVEDHTPTRTVLADLLKRRKFAVETADSLEGARRLSKQKKFDLLISDIGLPDGSGCSLMSELKDAYGLKGIALTGYGMEADLEKMKQAGFLEHLIKPVRIDQLERTLNAVLAYQGGAPHALAQSSAA